MGIIVKQDASPDGILQHETDDPSAASHLLAPVAAFGGDGTTPDCPRSSTDTLRSLDISLHIPKVVAPMDAEDSPWGGKEGPRSMLASPMAH